MAFPKIYIVGVGPGDPDLLTVKADRLIRSADLILYTDSLIPLEIVAIAPPTATVIRAADKNLEELLAVMIAAAKAGKQVVRLHDGDPCFYGAIQEQMVGLLAAGLDFEIVPGVSAYQLAAARLRVELTVPERVQTIILSRMTGRTVVPESEELASLAAHRSSLCLYLSAKHIVEVQARLLLHYPLETPVAICYRLGWVDEEILLVPLSELAVRSEAAGFVRSTLYVVSPALMAETVPAEYGYPERLEFETESGRSRLYSGGYDRLFKPPAIEIASTQTKSAVAD
jgi:precorrin-4/cobalt-precorrin-4 C11-methyltransferase